VREREYHFEVEPVNGEVKMTRVAENKGEGRMFMNLKRNLKGKRGRRMERRVPERSALKRRRRTVNAVHRQGRGEEMLLHRGLSFSSTLLVFFFYI